MAERMSDMGKQRLPCPDPPRIIQPHDVIGMRVSEDYRIDPLHPIGHALEPQFRRRIDQYPRVAVGDDNRWPRPPIARIRAGAHFASATNHWDSGARAGPKE